MNKKEKFYNCGELNKKNISEKIKIRGWIKKKRPIKNKIFIDLYDMHGITQLLFLETNKNSYLFAKTATNESVIQVEGEVLLRKTKNTLLKTGEIEVLVQKAKQLNQFAEGFPIDINNIEEILSEKHLKFRHLFLRNPQVKANLIFKHQVIKFLHQFFLKNNFIEIETPVLSRSYPEGAREFKVFSEAEKEAKYTLAQSPQIFKQLLMVGGFERYYQIAKCFRDETLRSDRQPEFLQLDFEMNFVSEKEIFHLVKKLLSFLWKKTKQVKKPQFKILTYKKAIMDYGIDKPDLRNLTKVKVVNQPEVIQQLKRSLFKQGIIKFIGFNKKINNPLKIFINKLLLEQRGKINCFYWEKHCQTFSSLITNKEKLKVDFGKEEKSPFGLFFVGENKIVNLIAGLTRNELIKLSFLPPQEEFSFVWINNWPMFTVDEKTNTLVASHHPFTALKESSKQQVKKEKLLACAYDLVINGYEVGSGSIRNHDAKKQIEIFKMLGFNQEKIKAFSFFTEALKYGCPPHGGFAIGLDRLLMIIKKISTIKELITFPKNSRGVCEMTKNDEK